MKCFVIQPFDKGKFDRRYADVYKPAIESAGFESYRVDHDPSTDIPIEAIENGIRDSSAVFADITLNNANVWFEVGFAIACSKPLCMVCSDERTDPFPFDIRHRRIITYTTGSPSDFAMLRQFIQERLNVMIVAASAQLSTRTEGISDAPRQLPDHELTCLGEIAVHGLSYDDGVSGRRLKEILAKSGYNEIATTLATRSLVLKGFVEQTREVEDDRYGSSYFAYKITDSGMKCLLDNQSAFGLTTTPKQPSTRKITPIDAIVIDDDEIPF